MAPKSAVAALAVLFVALVASVVAAPGRVDTSLRTGDVPCPVCRGGLVCAGKGTNTQCVMPKGEGMFCGVDPLWICAAGLTCEHGKCKKTVLQVGESCVGNKDGCAAGLLCVGEHSTLKCVMPKGEGMFCGVDPLWICAPGLTCEHGTCKKTPLQAGESCVGDKDGCAAGLLCVGEHSTLKCVMPKGEGMFCGVDPLWICAPGLTCEHGTCKRPRIPEGESCTAPGSLCEFGSVCAGKPTFKRCVQPMNAGESCGRNPFSICKGNLVCEHGTCKNPRIPVGGSCVGNKNGCAPGLVCVGEHSTLKCVRPMGKGKRCGLDPFWICAPGLTCEHGTCK